MQFFFVDQFYFYMLQPTRFGFWNVYFWAGIIYIKFKFSCFLLSKVIRRWWCTHEIYSFNLMLPYLFFINPYQWNWQPLANSSHKGKGVRYEANYFQFRLILDFILNLDFLFSWMQLWPCKWICLHIRLLHSKKCQIPINYNKGFCSGYLTHRLCHVGRVCKIILFFDTI